MGSSTTGITSVLVKLLPFLITLTLYFVYYIPFSEPSVTAAVIKILPIYSLVLFTYLHGRVVRKDQRWFVNKIMVGLMFSSIGDICLVWRQVEYFLLGIVAFAIAHIYYIQAMGLKPTNWKVGIPIFLVTSGALVYVMSGFQGVELSGLERVLLPGVPMYAILLTTMTWRAFARLSTGFSWSKLFAALGALSFSISDSIIGLDTFKTSIPNNQILIMTTYYAAQIGIALSVLDPRVSGSKGKTK